MQQTKLVSLIEVCVNVATGFILAWLVWLYLIPVFWPHHSSSAGEGFWITSLFTVVSVLRGYVWRRFFNAGFHHLVVNQVGLWFGRGGQKSEGLEDR